MNQWIDDRTLAASWLPRHLRHTWVGYLIGIILVAVMFLALPLLLSYIAVVPLPVLLLLVVITLMAAIWGTGPGLLVTLVGIVVLDLLDWKQHLEVTPIGLWLTVEDLLVVLIGGLVSVLVGENAHARRLSERLRITAEDAREHSEQDRQFVDTVLEVLPSGVALCDADGKLLRSNAEFKKIWGDRDRLLPAEGRPASSERIITDQWALARALSRGEISHGEEVQIVARDGQRKTILNAAAPIRDKRGTILGGVVAEMDVTEQKRLEEALRQSKHEVEVYAAQLETIFQTIGDGLIVTDASGRVLLMNRTAREHHGFTSDSVGLVMPAPEWSELVSISDADGHPVVASEQPIARLLRGEVLTSEREVDLFLHYQNGEEIQIGCRGAPIRDEMGQIVGAVEISRDVTAQRQHAQQSREALYALIALAEALVLPVESPDAGGEDESGPVSTTIHHFADLVQDIFGCQQVHVGTVEPETDRYTPVALIGYSPEEERRRWELFQGSYLSTYFTGEQIADLHEGKSVILDMRRNSHLAEDVGVTYTPSAVVAPLLRGEQLMGLLGLSYIRDEPPYGPDTEALVGASAKLAATLLEHQRLWRQRAEARATSLALQETSKQMDAFVGIVSHELKTPLTAIVLALQMTQRRLQAFVQQSSAVPRDVVGYVEGVRMQLVKVELQTKRLDRMVNDLLDLTRYQSGHLQLTLALTDLVEITRRVVEEQSHAAAGRMVHLGVSVAAPVRILADADRIGQVVSNYLTNALKYSPADQPVEVGLEVERSWARVWVRDHGPGLPEDERERIWNRFHRVPGIEVQSGTGVGLGLGLSICREIIELHGGQVGVESALGQGSTFWFTLPLSGDSG